MLPAVIALSLENGHLAVVDGTPSGEEPAISPIE
jgi:hypothetical protein